MRERTVTVIINNSDDRYKFIDGWHPRHTPDCVEAITWKSTAGSDAQAAEKAFSLLNNPFEDRYGYFEPDRCEAEINLSVTGIDARDIVEYHKNFHSLSVGDLVKVDDRIYACESLGWTEVTDKYNVAVYLYEKNKS
jgi:hypothetical protein